MVVENLKDFFRGKRILITGSTGSVGAEIAKQVLDYEPKVVRIFSNDETGLFNLESELKDYEDMTRYLVGDVRDIDRLMWAGQNIDIIFHAAALKHVPLCEKNPFDAVKTNVLGTQNVIEAAIKLNVDRMLTISTDKAVNPINVMGATKLLAERLTISANFYRGFKRTLFSCVRFGNVLDSRGSVMPVFRDQIKKGGPVTITDPNMTRFVMSIQQAINLVLRASTMMKGKEIFILKMSRLRIEDLARIMIEKYSSSYGFDPSKIEISYLGRREGEKIHEELITELESKNAVETEDMYIIDVTKNRKKNLDYNAINKSELLGKSEIRALIFGDKPS